MTLRLDVTSIEHMRDRLSNRYNVRCLVLLIAPGHRLATNELTVVIPEQTVDTSPNAFRSEQGQFVNIEVERIADVVQCSGSSSSNHLGNPFRKRDGIGCHRQATRTLA